MLLLSACLIMKDEELTIKTCLDSLIGVVDEVIIVDTGSTDRSIEIAKDLGARVYTYTWDGDFGRARNESMRYATGDYILYIDADEYLDPVQKHLLRPFLEKEQPDGLDLHLLNYVGTYKQMTPLIPISITRIFRRGFLFNGAIHEQIKASIQANHGVIKSLDVTIHHLGYLSEFVSMKQKIDRNIAILKTVLEKDADNLFHQSNLLAEYNRQGNHELAVPLAERLMTSIKRLPSSQWPVFTQRIYQHWISALEAAQCYSDALTCAKEASRQFPKIPEFRKRYADLLIRHGKFSEAKDQLMLCLQQGELGNAGVDMLKGHGSFYAASSLGSVWLELGDLVTARKWFMQAFFGNPRLEQALIPLTCLMPPEPALLRQHFESRITDMQTYGTYAEVYASLGISGADEVIARAESAYTVTPLTCRGRIAVALRLGGIPAVEDVLALFPFENNYLLLGLIHWERGDCDLADACFGKAGERGVTASALLALDYAQRDEPSPANGLQIQTIFRDLAAVRAEGIVRRLLGKVSDRQDVWNYLKIGPLKGILEDFIWPGDTLHECEENALVYFKRKDKDNCRIWLAKAESFCQTVTTTLIRCDLALADNNLPEARKVLYTGKELYPDSDMIQQVGPQVFSTMKLA